MLLLFLSLPAQAEWWLWESPNDNAEPQDQSQPLFDALGFPQTGNGVGQSFVPQMGELYRIDFMLKNRYDFRPYTIKLWEWVDLDDNGQTEDNEFANTVAGAPIWQDTISLPGYEDRVLITVFPRVNVTAGQPYYVEFSNADADGEFAVFASAGSSDPYPDGRARVNGIFQYPPVTAQYLDLYFRTYSGPQGAPPPLYCGETAELAPCFSPLDVWEPPDPPGPAVTAADLLAIVQARADNDRTVVLNGIGKYAHWYAMYEAFLYRVTADEAYAANAVAMFWKAMAWRETDPAMNLDFTWLEQPGWAYEWIKDSPTLTAADHEMIKTLLLHSGMRLWPARELGVNNHPLARAVGRKLVTNLVSAGEFATLSACDPGPPPACDGIFQDGEQLEAQDHADWEAYTLEIWTDFTTHWDILEDAGRYYFMDTQFLLELMLLFDPDETVWDNPGFKAFVGRLRDFFLPLGTYPNFGDTAGWNLSWVTPIWVFEKAAAKWQDPEYKWLAYSGYDYRRTHLKDQLLDGTPLQFWQAVYQEYASICHAYFALDPTVTATPPADQTETQEAGQDQVDLHEWMGGAAGIGQTFTATKGPLVRVDLKIRNGGSTNPATIRLWKWQGSHSATVATTPLYASTVNVTTAASAEETSLYPFVEVDAGSTYYFELSRDDPFYVSGAPDGAQDEYLSGRLLAGGVDQGTADLWFRTHSLTDDGSEITQRLESIPLRLSERGSPPRLYNFGVEQVPDKMILRSGYDADDLHAVVNLISDEYFHGQLEAGAVATLTNAGSVILVDSNYVDRREKDQSKLQTRRYWGGTHNDQPDPLAVSRFVDYRGATVAWLDWDDPHGWNAAHHRRYYFVKNGFMLVRDRTVFDDSLTVTTGAVWHAYDVHPDHGANWYALYNREPRGVNQRVFKNPEQYALLYMVDRPGIEMAEWEVVHDPTPPGKGNPPSAPFVITQRWSGDASPGTTRWFDSVLLPHGNELTPGEAAANIEIVYDDGTNVAFRITIGDETWTLVDNPDEITIGTASLTTDARYMITCTRPAGPNYVLTDLASTVEVHDGPGRLISLFWPERSSVEIMDTSVFQDTDSDGLVDAADPDDDNDGVADVGDPDPFDPFACEDADADDCDDCTNGPADPANDGPDFDLDGLCDLGDNCPQDYNADQADMDSDATGDLCDNCPTASNPEQKDGDSDSLGDVCDSSPCPGSSLDDLDSDGLFDYAMIEDFDCDGVLEMEEDIQTAIDALTDAGPKLAVIGPGSYLAPSAPTQTYGIIELPSNLTLEGSGQGITILNGFDATDLTNRQTVVTNAHQAAGDSNIILRDFDIDGGWGSGDATGVNHRRAGVVLSGCVDCRVERLTVHDTLHACLYSKNGTNVYFEDNTLHDCGNYSGLGATYACLYFYASDGLTQQNVYAINNTCTRVGASGITTRKESAADTLHNIQIIGNEVSDTRADTYARNCITIRGVSGATVQNNTCTNTGAFHIQGAAAYYSEFTDVDASANVLVDGMQIIDLGLAAHGIRVLGHVEDVTIRNVRVENTDANRECMKYINPLRNAVFEDLTLVNCGWRGLTEALEAGSGANPDEGIEFRNITIQGTGSYGMHFVGPTRHLILDTITIENAAAEGIYWESSLEDSLVSNVTVVNPSNSGLLVTGGVNNTRFEQLDVTGTGGHGISLLNTAGSGDTDHSLVEIVGSTFRDVSEAGITVPAGVTVVNDFAVSGNLFDGIGAAAVDLELNPAVTSHSVALTANTARDFRRASSAGNDSGIEISGMIDTVDVSFNVLDDLADQATSGIFFDVSPVPGDLSYLCSNTCVGTLGALECLEVNGVGALFQTDSDLDTLIDGCDACPVDPENDGDGDGHCEDVDNCPHDHNPAQNDPDSDGLGSVCENCPADYNPAQDDQDSDAAGDACDNCVFTHNVTQSDQDDDGEGDHCDLDDGLIYIRFDLPDEVTWQEELGTGTWNCYRGDLDVLESEGLYTQDPASSLLAERWCLHSFPWVADPFEPDPGQKVFYLTTGVVGPTESSLGTDSSGVERPNVNPCP